MQSIDSLRELNSKLLAEIAELRKVNAEISELREKLLRFAEVEAENAKLRQIIEENAKRDAENAEHKIRIEELEKNSADISAENAELKAELAKLRHDFDSSNLMKPQQPQRVTNEQNSCSIGKEEISEVTVDTSHDMPPINEAPSVNIETMEERETDTFLDEVHKKRVSDEIRQRNREKKLLHESANQEAFSISQDISSHDDRSSSENSEKNGDSVTNRDDRQKNILVINMPQENDDDTEFTKSQNIEQELIKELLSNITTAPSISSEATEQIPSVSHLSSSLDTTQNLVHLFQNTIRAGHEVILSWLYYSISFEKKVDEIRHSTEASDKTARSQIYKEMLEHLPDITLENLRMRTLRAKKIRMLFGKGGVGIDKIKQVTFSVYDISSLTINQIQSVIKNVTSAERTPNPNHVTSSVTNRDDQINASLISAEVTTSHPQIPMTNPTYDRSYFRNKILDQYPSLYREFSSENFDYYGITNEKICPLCKLDHDDEESLEGRYKAGSYFIKCEQREIEIVA